MKKALLVVSTLTKRLKGFRGSCGSNFSISHWLCWSSLQHSHTTGARSPTDATAFNVTELHRSSPVSTPDVADTVTWAIDECQRPSTNHLPAWSTAWRRPQPFTETPAVVNAWRCVECNRPAWRDHRATDQYRRHHRLLRLPLTTLSLSATATTWIFFVSHTNVTVNVRVPLL